MSIKKSKKIVRIKSPGKYCMLLELGKYNSRWLLIRVSSSSIFKIVTIKGSPIAEFVRLNPEDAGENEKKFRLAIRDRMVGVPYEAGDTRETFFARCLSCM